MPAKRPDDSTNLTPGGSRTLLGMESESNLARHEVQDDAKAMRKPPERTEDNPLSHSRNRSILPNKLSGTSLGEVRESEQNADIQDIKFGDMFKVEL